jgi:hypothetical protein
MLTLDRLGALTERNARISTDHAAALDTAFTLTRQAANAETDRFYASLDAAKAETVRDVANRIARSADAAPWCTSRSTVRFPSSPAYQRDTASNLGGLPAAGRDRQPGGAQGKRVVQGRDSLPFSPHRFVTVSRTVSLRIPRRRLTEDPPYAGKTVAGICGCA